MAQRTGRFRFPSSQALMRTVRCRTLLSASTHQQPPGQVRSTQRIEWRCRGAVQRAELLLECSKGTLTSLAHHLPASGAWDWAISGRLSSGWYRLKVRVTVRLQRVIQWPADAG